MNGKEREGYRKFDTLLLEVNLEMRRYPNLRAGQNAFNTLYKLDSNVANLIRGTKNDPFYHDDRLTGFYTACWDLFSR